MAITNYDKEKQLQANAAAAQPVATGAGKYNGLAGVSNGTAKQVANYQKYKEGAAVQQANKTLQSVQAQKPQGYTSKYSGQLDSILQQIQNPGEFNYEFNGDNLFKSYADLYTQKGKQASLDAQGQAASLTGGYGNSYGQAVGTQQYQQYLLGLFDKGLDLRDRAYQQYQDQLANNYNMYNTLQGADELDYGRYRDTVSDWQREEENAYNRSMNAQQMDRANYESDREYWTGLAEIENRQYNTEQDRQEAIRQYNLNYEENKRQYDESLAAQKAEKDQQYSYNYVMKILENGKMPSGDLLKKAGISEKDAIKMIVPQKKTGGGTSGGGTQYFRFTDKYYGYYDKNGDLHLLTQLPKGKKADEKTYYDSWKGKGTIGKAGIYVGLMKGAKDVDGK